MTQFKVDFNDFKRRDNTNLMEITLYNDSGEQITPNRDHQWSGKALKFGDGDKRLDQELAVTLDGDKIGVPSKQLENLPSGDYGLELWEVNNNSKTIYPSAGFVEFHIHRNADESLESVTPTTDLDKIIDDLHQAGLNVVVDGIEMLGPDATPSVTSEIRDGKNHIKLHVPRGDNGFYHYMVDLTDPKHDRNKWYYVDAGNNKFGSLGGASYFSFEVPLYSGIDIPYGKHQNGTKKDACTRQTILYVQSGWGAYSRKLIVLDDQPSLYTTDGKRLLTFAVPSDNNLTYAFYARGGLKVNITSDVPGLVWTPRTDTFSQNGATIPVLDDAPDPKALGLDDNHTSWALPRSQILTQAPAFQALQTQVNNSAVGTNLFSQSTALAGYVDRDNGTVHPATNYNQIISDYISVSASSNYTFQLWGTTPSGEAYWYRIGLYDSNKNFISNQEATGIRQTSNTAEHVSNTLTTTSTTAYVRVSFAKFNDYKAKFEQGSVATAWCPNPSEILTQADYAKIQAAIVALGGSL